jgi:hypothetical protein
MLANLGIVSRCKHVFVQPDPTGWHVSIAKEVSIGWKQQNSAARSHGVACAVALNSPAHANRSTTHQEERNSHALG